VEPRREEPRLRSPLARAVVPVLAGIAALAGLFGLLWIIAVVVTHNADDSDARVGADVFEVGRVDRLADSVERNGPILFPNLIGPAGERPVGLDHDGATDFEGWRVFSLVPAGNAPDCLVEIDRTTKELVDCDGIVHDAATLPPPERVDVLIDDDGTLTLDLQPGDTPAGSSP
jgi:hypothetical protein